MSRSCSVMVNINTMVVWEVQASKKVRVLAECTCDCADVVVSAYMCLACLYVVGKHCELGPQSAGCADHHLCRRLAGNA